MKNHSEVLSLAIISFFGTINGFIIGIRLPKCNEMRILQPNYETNLVIQENTFCFAFCFPLNTALSRNNLEIYYFNFLN